MKSLGMFRLMLSLLITVLFSLQIYANEVGATIFSQRCVLCHGTQGMGEGVLPMSLKNYPSANLLKGNRLTSRDSIVNIIVNGSSDTLYMPPWKDELSSVEIEAVADFVLLLQSNVQLALESLKKVTNQNSKSLADGKKIYETRCVLCHGKTGKGDGRMSKVVKTPPPFDLTKSVMPAVYLENIIARGGEAMGRSYQMPPWGDQLSKQEIDAVIQYIMTLRVQ